MIDVPMHAAIEPIAVDELTLAKALGLSVFFLRKDRQTKRRIPFYRIGTAIRYNPEVVRQALAPLQEGGNRPRGAK